ncbi:MAG: hypothetical protein R6V05_00095 [Candidatus Brocadiia bacterium]
MDGHLDAAHPPTEPPTDDLPGAIPSPPDRPRHLPGEETLDQPLTLPLTPSARSAASRWLARWLLFSGTGAGALAVGALVLAVAAGTRPVDWRSALLTFDCAVIILILRRSVVAGTPAGSACRWAFGVAGLAAAALAVQSTVLRAAIRFVYGAPAHSVLTGFFVFGLLGLGGCIVFVQTLRGVGWAARTAVVAAVVFLMLLLMQPVHGRMLVPQRLEAVHDSSAAYQAGLVAVVLCAAGFTISWEWLVRGGHGLGRRLGIGLVWTVLTGAAVAFVAWRVGQQAPPGGAFRDLWQNAAVWESVALLPTLLVGMAIAWQQRKSLPADCLEAVRLLWVLVLLGGAACLVVWLPARFVEGGLELLLVSTGVLAGMLGAWMGLTRGDWLSRWTFLPAAALVVGAMASLPALVGMAGPRGTLWVSLTVFLWCTIVAGLLFATAGLLLRRHRARRNRPAATAHADAESLARAGLLAGVMAAWVALVLAAGAPPLAAGMRDALGTVGAFLSDAVALAAGTQAANWLWDLSPVALPPALLAAALGIVLIVHALAAARIRPALWAMVALWSVPMAAVSLLVLLSLSRLFFPRPQSVVTGLARLISHSFAIRLLATVLACAAVARVWEALLSTASVARGTVPTPARAEPHGAVSTAPDEHLVFLVRTGVIAGAVGLGLAAVLCGQPLVRATLGQLAALARAAAPRLFGLGIQVGALSVQWTGNALAAAAVLYVAGVLSFEARRGRMATYPLVAALWTLLATYAISRCLVDLFVFWGQPWARTLATALLMVPAVGVLSAAGALWVRWWRLAVIARAELDRVEQSPPRGGPAFALGSLGVALCAVATAVVLHGALRTIPAYAAEATLVAEAVRGLAMQAVGAVAREAAYHAPEGTVAAAVALGVGSAVVLAVHLLARSGSLYWRAALIALWGAIVLAGVGLAGYALARARIDTWGPGELVWVLLGGLVVMRAVIALANVRRWSARPPEGTVCE